jgi:hypothetical protein
VPEGCSEASQTVFGPHRPHLLIGRKFAGSGSFRGGNSSLFIRRERHLRLTVSTRQLENNMGDVALLIRRKAGGCFERLVEKFSMAISSYLISFS